MFDRGTRGRFLRTLSPKKFDRATRGWFLRMTVGSPVPPKKIFRRVAPRDARPLLSHS